MGELFFELLGVLFEFLGEAFLEFVCGEILAFLWRAAKEVFVESAMNNPVLATFGYLILGMATGGLSLFFFPHPLVHPSRTHGISMLISPMATGSLMSLVGYALRRRGKQPAQIESFGYGFAFALGMAVIRFFFVK
jgi:hypothetical protein